MANLEYYLSKRPDETFTMAFINGPEELNDSNDKIKLSLTEPITGIYSIDSFTDEVEGETDTVYLKKYFKYKNGDQWSDLLDIEQITGITIDNCIEFDLELYYFYTKDVNIGDTIYLDNVMVNGEYVMTVYDSEAQLPNSGDEVILAPQDTYKVFGLEDFEVLSNHDNYDIKYRYTQDNNRTYTDYKPLTKENIENEKPDALRFAQFEYLIVNNGDPLLVYDIILEGDFQNVSANYLKTNRYGIKEDCVASFQGQPGTSNDLLTQGLSSYGNPSTDLDNENAANSDGFWKPYNFDKIAGFANKLGNDVANILGWNVDYHLTDPDANGIDRYLHEYTLKNITDYSQVRIIIPDNNFPIETVIMNQFNLDMFGTFEIHIMRDAFKNAFGMTKRPTEDDIIYICEANQLYIVKHAQAYKEVMNAWTYYKIILEKYEQRTNVRNLVQESKERIEEITDNTTLDELFGEDTKEENENIANKEQMKPKSFEFVRHKISNKVEIVNETLVVDNFETVKSYYNLSEKTINGNTAIDYKKADQVLGKANNRSFIFWFNFNNLYDEDAFISKEVITSYDIKTGVEFNFLDNYDITEAKGYNISYRGGNIFFRINENFYKIETELLTNVWYACNINVDQTQGKINFNIYRRNSNLDILMFHPVSYMKETISSTDTTGITAMLSEGYIKLDNIEESNSTGLELIKRTELTNYVNEEFTHDINFKLLGSNIKYTNLRVLNDIIPDASISNILLENVLRDEEYIILADNAGKQLITTNYFNKNWK